MKGDGSRAVLNVQFRTDRTFGAAVSEHYVDLDFTGWRYCELLFRERDSDRAFGLKWPYVRGAGYELCHRDLQTSRVSEINLLLNQVPAKGIRHASRHHPIRRPGQLLDLRAAGRRRRKPGGPGDA